MARIKLKKQLDISKITDDDLMNGVTLTCSDGGRKHPIDIKKISPDEEDYLYTPMLKDHTTIDAGSVPGLKFDTKVVRVSMEKEDWNQDCKEDFLNGIAIRLTSPDAFDRKGEKIYTGLQSQFFGSDYGDDYAFSDRYQCECGKYIGKCYDGIVCDNCNTVVEYEEADLTKMGWIIIDQPDFSIINPIYYLKLESALGKFDGSEYVIARIIKGKFTSDLNDAYDDKDRMNLDKHPFSRRGLIWFREHFKEVLEYYYKGGKTTKAALIEELMDDADKVFSHCIPAYTSVMRMETPGKKGDKVFKVKINTLLQSIIKVSNKINEMGERSKMTDEEFCTVERFLEQIQNDLSEIFTEEFSALTGKHGEILGKVIGGRYNFSSRNIIIAGSGSLKANEMEFNYSTFLELFRPELENMYRKLYGVTPREAENKWNRAKTRVDPDFYALMNAMINDPDSAACIHIMINRNPSINYGAFVTLKIVRVKPSLEDKTLTINTRIIKTLNADFDGDQINIFRIIGSRVGDKFERAMNPVANLYINRINGKFNTDMANSKDEVAVYYEFLTAT